MNVIREFKEPIRVLCTLLCLILFTVGLAYGQNETGRLVGKVVDPNGATVAGATVTIKSVDTGISREMTTTQDGFYTVAGLQPGEYDLTVRATGFADRTQRIEVGVGSAKTVETQLSVTPVTGETTVTPGSGGVEVRTLNQQLSDPISGRQIRELPTVTRDPYELVNLSGNVTAVNTRNGVNATGNSTNSPRGLSFSINGQSPTANNYLLDGGENLSISTIGAGQNVPLESVQEIQVVTNGFMPEFGRALGGIVNVATRSGGNSWRGSLFEFHRNRELSTNSFENNALGLPKGHLVANQFGYAIGGPIVKDRLFFFNSTELIRNRSRETRYALVPTAQLLAASNAATQAAFAPFTLGTPINGRVFTVADVNAQLGITNPAGNAFASLPGTTPVFGISNFIVNADQGAGLPQNSGLTVSRVDWNINDRSS
ncbi:MAG TPA: carboxypeptidase regulatory-like domain-containing protein, partial [Blastocatellia bacterium]|nr:carboxypeptidase regulatory-like domain-containing protein [Blastocatellia bacterium]